AARGLCRSEPQRHGGNPGRCPVTGRYRLAAIVLLGIVFGVPAAAYLKLGTRGGGGGVTLGGGQVPIRYFVTNRDVDGVTAPQFSTAVQRAFLTWHGVPNT